MALISVSLGLEQAASEAKDRPEFTDAEKLVEFMPWDEAVEYMKSRTVLSKAEYYKLAGAIKAQAFTVSRIADGDLRKKVQGLLVDALNEGQSLPTFWKVAKEGIIEKVGMGSGGASGAGGGFYWETVYRTNVQTSYNYARALSYETNPPEALEFLGIRDSRQTDICRAASGVIRPYGDAFWATHWPPLHFNCRSTVRAIYDKSRLPQNSEGQLDWSETGGIEPAAKGFGFYPTSSESFFKVTAAMQKRMDEYGVTGEIKEVEKQVMREEEKKREELFENIKKKTWFTGDIQDADKDVFLRELKKADNQMLEILNKYTTDMRGDFYSNKSTYNTGTRKINIILNRKDPRSLAAGFELDIVAFFHEAGHWLDYNALGAGKTIREALPDLQKKLKEDALSYANKVLKTAHIESGVKTKFIPLQTLKNISLDKAQIITDDIHGDIVTNSSISDLFEGITGGYIAGKYNVSSTTTLSGYGHDKGYWGRGEYLELEALAHFFAATAIGDVSLEPIKKHFPSAYDYFITYAKGLL